jgi:hypothetical protein
MRYVKILSAIAIASFLLISCENSKSKELNVPKEASMVVYLDGASITSKADWKDLLQADWFRRQKQMTKDSFDKQLLEDPEKSGVDLKSDFIYFMHKRDFITYSVFQGNLKSSSDFEKLLQQKNPGKKIEDVGAFNFMHVDNSGLVSWTSSKFIYISGLQLMNANTAVGIDSLKAYASALYDLKKEASIESNEKYAALLKETGDIHFWTNSADALSDVQFGPTPVIAASAMMQGNITAGTINFENGRIVAKTKQYLNPTLSKLIERYNAKPLTADLLNHVSPGASIVIAMNYHPQLIKDFLKISATESTADQALEDYDLTFDQLLTSTKGEILITASELGPQQGSDEESEDDIFPFGGKLLFAASLNNDSAFKKVEALIKQPFPGAATRIQNNWFLVGNSTATIDQFFASNNNTAVIQKLSGHPVGIYFDIQKGLEQWNVHGFDSSLLKQIEISKKFWRDVVSTGGDFTNSALIFETTVNLADQSTNSLKQLAKYSMEMSALAQRDEYVLNHLFPKNRFLAYKF